MDNLRVIETGDGSHSLLHTALNETYHSIHGAVRESMHVFIDHGLRMAEMMRAGDRIKVLEIGFGTGLNALLTLLEANRRRLDVVYESWEKCPLPESLWQQLNYGEMLGDPKAFQWINTAPWNTRVRLTPHFELYKRERDVLVDPMEGDVDLIYYDAFAPSRQPEMWALDVMRKITSRLVPGGIWVTYCAKGQMKRDLASLGLTVETLQGPPGKKEMTRAIRRSTPH